MAYGADQKPSGLTALTSLDTADTFIVGDTSADSTEAVKAITKANLLIDFAAETQTLTNKTIDANGTGNSITNIENADIKADAAIAVNKLAALTASEMVITDTSGFLASAAVATYPSLTELTYVKGVTSAIQTQMDTKGVGDFLADGTVAMTGDLNLNGSNIDNGGTVFLIEQAAADADVAGSGQIWVKTATPNELWFTDDAGTDVQLGVAGGGDVTKVGTPANDQVGVWTGDGTIEGTSGLTYNTTALTTGADIVMTEKADHSSTPSAGSGYLWTKNTVPSTLIFTDDAGTDVTLGAAGGGISNIVEDVTPQLGATLDTNAFNVSFDSNKGIAWTFDDSLIVSFDGGGATGNRWDMEGGTAGNSVGLYAAANGSDTDVPIDMAALGTSPIRFGSNLELDTGSSPFTVVTQNNRSLSIAPNGTGDLILDGLKWPQADGAADTFLKTDGAGQLSLAALTAASTTVAGVIEVATAAETDTGTDATRALSPDGFQDSKRNIRWLAFELVEAATDCATATNIAGDFVSPIAGTILQSDTTPFYFYATNSTAGTTGTMVVDVSIGGTSIMTTNKLDFDSTEKTTTTAATPPDLTTTALAVGDVITIDIDAIHTTAAKGLILYMAVRES